MCTLMHTATTCRDLLICPHSSSPHEGLTIYANQSRFPQNIHWNIQQIFTQGSACVKMHRGEDAVATHVPLAETEDLVKKLGDTNGTPAQPGLQTNANARALSPVDRLFLCTPPESIAPQ